VAALGLQRLADATGNTTQLIEKSVYDMQASVTQVSERTGVQD